MNITECATAGITITASQDWILGINLDDYVEFYNERRMHFSLDINIYETPLMAFYHKQATKDAREQNPDWMGADING